ncbi:hypothetical protein BH24ACT16_BH24ACT16_10820 [soil metagenome]|jgi:hypothetical protein
MMRRFIKDEDGVALGLAVILIVIVGVMGAGLLVFVRNDLEAVVQVNQGQQAFEATEAGVQAAKRHLLSNACAESYDGAAAGTEDPDNPCGDSEESDWSYAAVSGENDTPGRQLTFDGKNVDVSVRHLTPTTSPADARSSCDTTDPGDECFAPDVESDYPQNREYFQIESTGESDNGDARRRVEAVFYTRDAGVPEAYFTPGNVTLNGSTEVSNVSIFSLGDVEFKGGASISGEDLAYGDWSNPPFNSTARPGSITEAGIGSAGNINFTGGADASNLGVRDFDSSTTPTFVENTSDPQSSDEITFPFSNESQMGQRDEQRMNFLRDEAKANGVYYTSSGGTVDVGSDFAWPADADERTVVFVEYTGEGNNRAEWEVGDESDPPVEGTLVVKGGNFRTTQNEACLRGVVIIRGGIYEDGDSVDSGGNTCLQGFVNASGDIDIKGSVEPFASGDVANRPGFYYVEQWSWRELYE